MSTYVIGLMSGTSLDGVDLVYVKFNNSNQFEIKASETVPYTQKWMDRLKQCAMIPKGSSLLVELDILLGKYLSELIVGFIESNNITKVDLIASHGHTVHHQPEMGYTLQIGCGKEIYQRTKIKTIYDFRTQDVALGGQGAPLVPVGDELLFGMYDYCLNLGGFSNVSFQQDGVRRAFDICPVNTVLNFYANQLGLAYDDGGKLSKQGNLYEKLLEDLNNLEFYQNTSPKSLGVEFLNEKVYPLLSQYKIPTLDLMRTFVEHVAYQIANTLNKGTVLVTGGGAYHSFLIERIHTLNVNLSLIIPDSKIVEYKEALVFALLGKLRNEGQVNCLSSVTGCLRDHSTGIIVG